MPPRPSTPAAAPASTLADGTVVGHVGELHPKVVAALGLPARTVAGELDLDVLTAASEATVQARTLHTFPMAQSDVAVVVDESVPADAVQRSLRDGAGEHLEALTLFDVYRGDQVGEGRKSLAYRLTFRAPDRTLTTDEVSACATPRWGGGRGGRGGAAGMSVPTEVPVDDEGEVAPEPASEDGRGGHLVAVVTGASRGIGRFVADALEDAGYAVERGSSAVAPVTDRAALTAWVDEIVERHGRIDVLVNNAGVIDTEVDLFASDPEQWWHTQEVNVLGAYLMTWLVAPHMLAAGGGRDRQRQQRGGPPAGADAAPTTSSKTALARVTGSTHLAGWARGIRAFDLMPGVVRTDMTAGMDAHAGRTEWTDPAEVTDLVLALVSGELDAWSGRFVRAGIDTVGSLGARADAGLAPEERTLALALGESDPLT